MSQREVAKILGISYARVAQIEERALHKLKQGLIDLYQHDEEFHDYINQTFLEPYTPRPQPKREKYNARRRAANAEKRAEREAAGRES